jgi:serine/threonine protein kinase/tetratricopeptide (TPR) repeat protein
MASPSNLHHVEARELFVAATAKPPGERAAFLERACDGRAEVRRHVESLLEAHDRAGEFLAGATLPAAAVAAAGDLSGPTAEAPGARIGSYTIVRFLGEGGFGAVYLAEQERPVRRTVALKVIKPGMDTRQVIARFEAERQALAMMGHPNIARVFDAGTTAAGRPYFVMEWVPGVPITDYCDEKRLPTRQRLELFVQVCRAVQHAHTKGIIHRDIKPTNILVAEGDDGQPLPKVIDFGIAKATDHDQRLSEHTCQTDARQMIGTPQYMSPEQAEGGGSGGGDVDTRSDVYSLGVLLYQLLTGTTPFDGHELRGKSFVEMQRMLREVEPPKPSTRLGALGETLLPTVAAQRGTEPRRLSQIVRGELDWIVMKALEKERGRRYETASDLASDVERYLRDELVRARPPSRAYLLRKIVRRHRVLIGAGVAIAAAVLVGMGLALWGLQHARHERDNALNAKAAETRQLAIANDARAKAREVNDLMRDLYVSTNRRLTGNEADYADVIAAGAARLESGILRDQPDLEASLRNTLGHMYVFNHMLKQAEGQMELALDLRRRICPPGGNADLADSLNDVGWVLQARGEYQQAEPLLRESLAMRRKLVAADDPVLASSVHSLALVLRRAKREAEAIPLFREALDIRLAHADKRVAAEPRAAENWANRAHVLSRRGDFQRSLEDYTRAIELDPTEHWWWYNRIILRLFMEDVEGYRRDCRDMFKRFSKSSDIIVAGRASKILLLAPEAPLDLELARPAIDAAVESGPQTHIGWMRITKGMLDYRLGRYGPCLSWLQRGIDSNIHINGIALAEYFAAMALYRVGKVEQARDVLARAIKLTPDDPYALGDRDPIEAGSVVHGWMVCKIARREAERLIKPGPTTARAAQTRPAQTRPMVPALPPKQQSPPVEHDTSDGPPEREGGCE